MRRLGARSHLRKRHMRQLTWLAHLGCGSVASALYGVLTLTLRGPGMLLGATLGALVARLAPTRER